MFKSKDVLSVFGLIVMLIYGWSLYHFFLIVPAWRMFLETGEILVMLSQVLAVSLFDSLLMLLVIAALAFFLPHAWYRNNLVLNGGLTVIIVFSLAVYLAFHVVPLDRLLSVYLPAALITFVILKILFMRVPGLWNALEAIADRSTIFLYCYVPPSLIGLFMTLARTWRAFGE